jgi:hypothetical protein
MRARRPADFFLIGAPKAGTSALYAALVQHPELFMSRIKEPKYYMCGDSPPPAYKGPGDAHSSREWVWQRDRYLALFDEAPEGMLCGEATPFYLYNRDARRRLAVDNPSAKLIAILRDPVDRAYSNWMHLWMDGLEPCGDLIEAVQREQQRIDAGWAPFWHYRSLGMYGRQVSDLLDHFPREQLLLLRYADLVADPRATLAVVTAFLGVTEADVREVPRDNSRVFVSQGPRARALSSVIRTGAWVGQHLPPQVWRRASRPLVDQLHRGGTTDRPKLTLPQRNELLQPHREDIALLERVTGLSYKDWLGYRDGGTFDARRTAAELSAVPEP